MSGHEWNAMPWKHLLSLFYQAKVLPTFLAAEWTFRLFNLVCLWHAVNTNSVALWLSSWICGTCNDIFFMFLPFCDNFWQAQATVMITPRLPLYIIEMYAVVLYTSAHAARSLGFTPVCEAMACGLLAHVLYGVYDINGPRFLWWTWHDGDPAVSVRNVNAPTGSSMWILTYCGLHALLFRWTNDPTIIFPSDLSWISPFVQSYTPPLLEYMPLLQHAVGTVASTLNDLHATILPSHLLLKILFTGAVCTPTFMVFMGIGQVFSLDTIGIPGMRTYAFTLIVYVASIAAFGSMNPSLQARNPEDKMMFCAVVFHFVVHCVVALFGNPMAHTSTGCHQECGPDDVVKKDIMLFDRKEYLSKSGPTQFSCDDFSFPDTKDNGSVDAGGKPMILPVQDLNQLHSRWYTVKGKSHRNKELEIAGVVCLAVVGMFAYGFAWTG